MMGKGRRVGSTSLPGGRRGRGIRRYRLHSLEASVGQGEAYPYFGASSAGATEGGKGLRQQGGLLFHQFGFGHPGQIVYFQ